MDERSKLSIRADAMHRFLLANVASGVMPLFIVTEFPKSGGSWVGQMLADYLSLPFPRNKRAPFGSAVHHAHYLYSPLLKNVTCVMRDGRDVMVSYYFQMLFQNERSSPILIRESRQALRFADYEDVRKNLPRFIEFLFESETKSKSPFKFTWPRFVRSWIDRDVAVVKYEELVADGTTAMKRVLEKLTGGEIERARVEEVVRRNSFERQAKRPPGNEDRGSFLRRGLPGDWKEKFTREAAEIFDRLAGAELRLLGYEPDNSWVGKLPR